MISSAFSLFLLYVYIIIIISLSRPARSQVYHERPFSLFPAEAEDLRTCPGVADFKVTLGNALGDGLSLPLQNNLGSSGGFRQLVELPAKLAEEALELLLRDIGLRNDSLLSGILKGHQHKLSRVRLGEDARRRGLVRANILGSKRVRGAVGSARV